jgi:hypothetical protein
MTQAEPNDATPAGVDTESEVEVIGRHDADDLQSRPQRIRDRSEELIAELGADHPLVAQALARAEALEREAAAPGQIHLR